MDQTIGISPSGKARLAGVFEALEGFPAAFGQTFVLGSVVVTGSAAATSHNILNHEVLFRLGFAIPLVAVGFHIAWAVLFYQLFKPVHQTMNLLATFVILVGCAIQTLAAVLYLTPLLILQDHSLSALATAQQQALALVFINLSHLAFDVYLIFFGLWCALTGYLIFRSTFLPWILGVLLAFDGIGWMTYLVPSFATAIFPLIAIVSGVAEFSLILWLVIFGVNNRRWFERASAAGLMSVDRRLALAGTSSRER